ncbi:MAG TPA: GAF domain-containing protein, partial [Caldimonas sp.]
MRPAPLRHRLLLLAAVAILPLALMSGIALQALFEQQRRQTEQSSLDLARALATAVDTELRLTVSALQSLALTDPLGTAGEVDLANAYESAKRVLAARPEWRAVLLATPAGVPLFNTGTAFGEPAPRVSDLDSLAEVVETGAPVVGRLARGPLGNLGIPVRVPVERGGKLRYVLTAIVRPDAILRVVNAQRIPDDWIVSVFDSKNVRVARSRDHERFVGSAPSPSLQALIGSLGDRNETVGASSTIEGTQVHTAIARVRSNHWVVALGVPSAVEASALRDSALAYGGGILLSLGLGSLAAWLLSGSIATPIARLRDAASALGRGAPVEEVKAGLVEIEAVAEALVAASALSRQGEAEREMLLDAERTARATAEQAQARLQQLVGAGALLSRSLEEATTLAGIASLIVPSIADICRIDLLDKSGTLQRKLTHHVDPAREAEMLGFVSQNVSTPDTPGSFAWAVATGKTFFANLEPGDAERFVDPTFRAFVQGFGIGAACVVPLIARGRTIGAMCALQAESGRRFGAEDGALIGELAQRAALALDNVRLFGEARDALHEAEV